MTTHTLDFSQIDLTGKVQWGSENIGSVYYNGERLWPFGIDLLFTGGINGASYLPDAGNVYGTSALAAYSDSITAVVDTKNGTPTLGPELVTNGSFGSSTGWSTGTGWTISGGVATFAPGTASGLSQDIPTISTSKVYRLTMSVVSFSGASTSIRLGNSGAVIATIEGTGEKTFILMPTTPGTLLFIYSEVSTAITIDNISLKEISGYSSRQASVTLRPLFGRAPLSRRNLLIYSEDFGNAAWVVSNSTKTSGVSDPFGGNTATTLTATANNGQISQAFIHGLSTLGQSTTYTLRVWLRRRTGTGTVWFSAINGGSIVSIPVTSTWAAYTITGVASSVSASALIRLATSGDQIDIAFAQLELGSSATTYQKVVAATDVTETNVLSYPFIRPDLSDDRLDTLFPNSITGDIVIAGRNGTFIEPVSYAANTTFQFGAVTYTNGPNGTLRAAGDIVGYSVFNKTLNTVEKQRLTRFYKRRGAKGLFTTGTGPELITNGTFDTGTTGWTNSGNVGYDAVWDSVNQRVVLLRDASGQTRFNQSITTVPRKSYVFTFTRDSSSAVDLLINDMTTNSGSKSSWKFILTATATLTTLQLRLAGNGSIWIDNISVRELRPEEEW